MRQYELRDSLLLLTSYLLLVRRSGKKSAGMGHLNRKGVVEQRVGSGVVADWLYGDGGEREWLSVEESDRLLPGKLRVLSCFP